MPDTVTPMAGGKLADPEWRKDRARRGAAAVNSPEGLAKRLVAGWPALTPEQRTAVRTILRPVQADGEGR